MKKAIIILVGLVLVLMVGVGIFLAFSKKSEQPTKTAEQTSTSTSKLTKISDDTVVSPVPSFDNNAVWYFNSNGQLFHRSLDGSSYGEYSFPQPITNFKKAYWPPTGNDMIISSVDSTASQVFTLYDSANNQFKILPKNIQAFDWMPDGKRILYVWKSGDGKTQQLVLANSDASGFRIISQLFWPDFSIKVSPDGKYALLIRTQVQDLNKIYIVNLETGKFDIAVGDGKNIYASWVNPQSFVYLQATNGNYGLKYFDLGTSQSSDLGINTVQDRFVVDRDGKNVYADVPGLSDQMMKVNLAAKQATKVYEFDSTIRPNNLFMDDQTLMFVNLLDGKLYSLSL